MSGNKLITVCDSVWLTESFTQPFYSKIQIYSGTKQVHVFITWIIHPTGLLENTISFWDKMRPFLWVRELERTWWKKKDYFFF